jgi:hypothetical protein
MTHRTSPRFRDGHTAGCRRLLCRGRKRLRAGSAGQGNRTFAGAAIGIRMDDREGEARVG